MARKGDKKPQRPVGDPTDPQGFGVLLERFLEALRVNNYSETTVSTRRTGLVIFIAWAGERGLSKPCEVTRAVLERYQRHLYHYRKKDGRPLGVRTQYGRLMTLRAWFKWLSKQRHVPYNPASELEMPRQEKRLPRHVLNAREVEMVLGQADIGDPLGLRDRAIMETLYSTGMRRLELIQLGIYDIDAERGTVMIRKGKGNKDRMVPVGERAVAWIDKYLAEVRPMFAMSGNARDVLFLTNLGEEFTTSRLTRLVGNYVKSADTGKKGSCHLFRHSMATLMLEGGADIRFIQAMLGHAKLDTTAVYTQVAIRKLKEIHTATHPAKMGGAGGGKRDRPDVE